MPERIITGLMLVVAFASIASFLYLSVSVGQYNSALRNIVIVDLIASVFLIASIVLYFLKPAE